MVSMSAARRSTRVIWARFGSPLMNAMVDNWRAAWRRLLPAGVGRGMRPYGARAAARSAVTCPSQRYADCVTVQ